MNRPIPRPMKPALPPPPAETKPRSTVERFIDCLRDIEKVGQVLQHALFKRKPDDIWQAIDQQEQFIQRFVVCYNEYSATRGNTPTETDSMIVEISKRIKSIHRTNRAMANAFLDIINKTLSGLSASYGGNPYVYNSSGRVGQVTAPILVQQQG